MKNGFAEMIKRGTRKVGFEIQKNSPEILLFVGIGLGIYAAVKACQNTPKLSPVLDDAKDAIGKIHECHDDPEIEDYSNDDYHKDLVATYARTGVEIVKIYGPSVAMGALSLTCIFGSHHILKKRNVALAAAYAAVDRSYREYRKRLIERFGDKVDRELKYNLKSEEIKEVHVDKNGKEKELTKEVTVVEPNKYSEYSKFFDAGSKNWKKDPEYNRLFLDSQEKAANEFLRQRGHLFLNEVYDMLGIPRTIAGNIVGWIYDEKHPHGDNYISFGSMDVTRVSNRDFINGYEPVIILDFNVDGPILEDAGLWAI